ncbi:hypothetical protein BRUCa_0253 [Brucella melitensis]|nr:hypothetical protein BM28_A0255 [Brucella melitensis M28]AEW16417.1 hypothetical protein BAA13334_I00061 [Brucella abortus A13334]
MALRTAIPMRRARIGLGGYQFVSAALTVLMGMKSRSGFEGKGVNASAF